jgi:hypothetical protein
VPARVTLSSTAARGRDGRVVVYFENKEPGGRGQPDQPSQYLRCLAEEIAGGAHGKLLASVGEPDRVRGRVGHRVGASTALGARETLATLRQDADDARLASATRHQVGGWIFEAGAKGRGGDDWLDSAAKPDARADQRLLAELVWYLPRLVVHPASSFASLST